MNQQSRIILGHAQGCTPFKPCLSCKIASFLRNTLSEADFNALCKLLEEEEPRHTCEEAASAELLYMTVEQLDFTIRTSNALIANDIKTVQDLVRNSWFDLLQLPHLGKKEFKEIVEVLHCRGITLAISNTHSHHL